MNLEIVKNKINLSKGKVINFKFNGSRNKVEEFTGVIVDTFPSIFLIKLKGNSSIRSFSYSDVLIRRLTIIK